MFYLKLESRIIALSIAVGALVGFLVVASVPSARPYSITNSGERGFTKLVDSVKPVVTTSLRELADVDAERALLVSARSSSLGGKDIEYLLGFVERGGVLLAYGNADFLLALAERLGVNLSLRGRVYDAVFNAGTRSVVRVEVNSSICSGVVFLKSPYAVNVSSDSTRVASIAFSSFLSYTDQDGNGFYDLGEFIGSSPIGYEVAFGRGLVVLFFTDGFLDNGLISYNEGFLTCLASTKF
ncbi:MAG: hypothetical protein QXH88_07570, partial [Sulfolobales archaeon]